MKTSFNNGAMVVKTVKANFTTVYILLFTEQYVVKRVKSVANAEDLNFDLETPDTEAEYLVTTKWDLAI